MGEIRKCYMKGSCFARFNGRCLILTNTDQLYCSFQKKDRHYSKGEFYPDNPSYYSDLVKKKLRKSDI